MPAAAPALPTYDDSFSTVFQGVHQRAYFQKLASFGYAPKNAQQVESLLKLAGEVDLLYAEDATKQAADAADPFAAASAALQAEAQERGFPGFQKAAADNEALAAGALADQFMADPDIYNSMLVLKQAEANGYAQQVSRSQQ